MRENKLVSRRRDKIYGKMENALFRHFEKKFTDLNGNRDLKKGSTLIKADSGGEYRKAECGYCTTCCDGDDCN